MGLEGHTVPARLGSQMLSPAVSDQLDLQEQCSPDRRTPRILAKRNWKGIGTSICIQANRMILAHLKPPSTS